MVKIIQQVHFSADRYLVSSLIMLWTSSCDSTSVSNLIYFGRLAYSHEIQYCGIIFYMWIWKHFLQPYFEHLRMDYRGKSTVFALTCIFWNATERLLPSEVSLTQSISIWVFKLFFYYFYLSTVYTQQYLAVIVKWEIT